jgi:repressor LexA
MADAPTPTLAQLRVMELIEASRRSHGYPPTIRELADATGVSSTHTVACHLEALKTKEFVTWSVGKGRTLSVTDAGQRWLKVGAVELERQMRMLRMEQAARRARRAA